MLSPPDHRIIPAATPLVLPDNARQSTVTGRSAGPTNDNNLSIGLQQEHLEPANKVASESASEMVNVKLSSAVKHLLSLRNPLPPIGPSADALTRVFDRTLGDLRSSSKPQIQVNSADVREGLLKSWIVVTMATLLTTNTPSTIAPFYHFVTRISDHGSGTAEGPADPIPTQKRAERVALMREAGLKCTVLTGIPKVINTLGALREALDNDVKAEVDALQLPRRDASSQRVTRERGAALFDSIYSPLSEKLLNKLGRSHPDFPGFIIEHAYGGVLSNPLPEPSSPPGLDTPLISRTLTSALAVACLRAQGGVGPQLTSHVFGLLKAHHEGNQTAVEQWISTEEGAEWVLRAVDQLCDVVQGFGETSSQDSARL